MDTSQYKDYVLTLLFTKYVSDKYTGKPDAMIEIPAVGGLSGMVKLEAASRSATGSTRSSGFSRRPLDVA